MKFIVDRLHGLDIIFLAWSIKALWLSEKLTINKRLEKEKLSCCFWDILWSDLPHEKVTDDLYKYIYNVSR